ncbi:uncharacterized protein LOC124817332 [Hydra vulgaris]|uniref:uncharacterized protein LOC124817332 n=1 Tax=Hydra vulgaris TaxID=6087 RepID=UPI0032EA47CD
MSSQDTEGDEEVSAFFRNVQEIRAEEVLPREIMDKLKKLEDSVENLKKLEHSMGLIFQQLKNLENSIASSAVPSAPQAIISGNLFSILMQFYGFYVYLNLIITVFMQLHKCLTYVTLYTFFFYLYNSINIICSTISSINIICSTISINIICSATSINITCCTININIICSAISTSSNNISINIICSTISSINIICSTISNSINCSTTSNSINCSTTSNNICRTISIISRFPAISFSAPRSNIFKSFLPVESIWGR